MDFLVTKSAGHGVQTAVREAFGDGDTLVVFDFGRSDVVDFGAFIEQKIQATQGRPLTLLFDLSDVDPQPYMIPMLDIVQNRKIAGESLPEKSAVIIVMSQQDPHLVDVPAPLLARTVSVDLPTPGLLEGQSEATPEEVAKVVESIRKAIYEMVETIAKKQGGTTAEKSAPDPDAPTL